MFLVAAVTYLLTMEPTASFWDCGEFTAQGYKLEVGHPPGNPIYMLAARFFANFASSPSTVSVCVNTMSALLSAGTILLLFWTITHLVKRLIVKDEEDTISWQKMAVIMGSGVVGALAYTWSDTFWFSAAEAGSVCILIFLYSPYFLADIEMGIALRQSKFRQVSNSNSLYYRRFCCSSLA